MSAHTKTSLRRSVPAGLLVLGMLFTPLFIKAQVEEPGSQDQADLLHARAMTAAAFITHVDDVAIIVRMHEESASLRDGSDPRAFDCWVVQAALLHHIGEYDQAVSYLKRAADLALDFGSPGPAAHALLDAAAVRKAQGLHGEADGLTRSAWELSTRSELSATEQRQIERRIVVRR